MKPIAPFSSLVHRARAMHAPWHPRPMPPTQAHLAQISATPSSRGFVMMLEAFRASGGTTRAEDLASFLQARHQGDRARLLARIANGELIAFPWRHTHWLPMFQFDLRELGLLSGPRQVMSELAGEFDGWQLAAWFAEPNAWLAGRSPVQAIDSDLPAVLEAARADRFVVGG